MQLSDIFGHVKHRECWEIDFNDKFPFSKENFRLVQRFIRTNYNKTSDVIFTREQWGIVVDWFINLNHLSIREDFLDLEISKNNDIDRPTKVFGSNVLGNNADKCYFIVR